MYPNPDLVTSMNRLQRLEQRLIDLDRKLTKHYEKSLETTDNLTAANNYICNGLHSHTQTLTNQSSTINNTKHIVTAQARTISAQARKIASQQEVIEIMQRDIFRLSRWHTESQHRINEHDEALRNARDDGHLRDIWAALNEHLELFEYAEKESYWMNVYSKQMMMLRAMELEQVAVTNDDDAAASSSSCSADTMASIAMNQRQLRQDILLDRIVVHMVQEHAPDHLQGVCDGFEVVHGVSPLSYEDIISSQTEMQME